MRDTGYRASAIIDHVRTRRIFVGGLNTWVDFVDREAELEKILRGDAVEKGCVTVLYGPKGCGKTTLLRVLTESAVSLRLDEPRFVFIEHDEDRGDVNIVSDEKTLKAIERFYRERLGVSVAISISLGGRGENPHVGVASNIVSILERLGEDHGEYVVIIDEYRVSNPEDLENYLERVASRLANTNERMQLNRLDRLITLVISTSDALAARAWDSVRWKVGWALMWNLPREASEKLSDQLGIKEDRDLLWRLAGGNPRALEEIRRRGLSRWLDDVALIVRSAVEDALDEARRVGRDRGWVLEQIVRVSRDIDELFGEPIRRHLLSKNIVIDIRMASHRISVMPGKPLAGREYAYQIPAYYHALRSIARKAGFDIDYKDILEEVAGKT